jgi:hypothetical protein
MLNECHKAKTVKLDENGNPVMSKDKNAGCTQTARAVLARDIILAGLTCKMYPLDTVEPTVIWS